MRLRSAAGPVQRRCWHCVNDALKYHLASELLTDALVWNGDLRHV